MKFANIIEAIKALRVMPMTNARIEKRDDGRYEILSTIGLKDAKDMVEAIMELGVQRFLDDELRKRKAPSPIHPSLCGAWDRNTRLCCNLSQGHGGAIHVDHVTGKKFYAGGEEIP